MRRSVWLIGLLVVVLTLVGCLGGSSGLRLTLNVVGRGEIVAEPNKASYRRNEVVKLKAVPEDGWLFSHWEGGGPKGSNPEAEVVMTGNITVTAVFTKPDQVPQTRGKIRGYVSDGQGGPAVKGASVTWNGAYQTTTNDQGEFVLYIPADEVGDLIVERPDTGVTKVQAVQVGEGEEIVLDIPTRRALDPNASLTPPTVELNVSPGEILSGTVNLHVKVTGDNDAYVIYVYLGGEQRAPREGMVIEESELELAIDTTEFENGATYLRVLAYDDNENAVIYMVPVTIYNQAPWVSSPPSLVPLMALYAETYAENIGYYSKQSIIQRQQLQNRLAVADMADLEAVPADSMLMIYILWLPANYADGYKVYRSFDAANYRQIATIANKHGAGVFQVVDYSPQLAPGKRTFYKVVPYNSAGEGPGTVVDVTPLPPMDVYLVSPGNGETDVELQPTFVWDLKTKAEFPADTDIQYLLTVYDATSWRVMNETVANAEEFKLETPLNPGHVYTWDIADSVAWRPDADGPTGYSEAYSYGGLIFGDTDTGSRNGEFIFTTTMEIEE